MAMRMTSFNASTLAYLSAKRDSDLLMQLSKKILKDKPMIEKIIQYKAFDGEVFDTLKEAEEYQNSLEVVKNKLYHDFLKTYSGQSLLKEHSLDKWGNWKIEGEDPNCDFGGSHHSPHLEYVYGPLRQVIKYAVGLEGFWRAGAGGKISFVDIKVLDEILK